MLPQGATVVVGLQFGDEGKGKMIDYFARDADLVVRYNGGPNAGHTVIVGEKVYKFRLMPSGIAYGVTGVIANGVVIDPQVLEEEVASLEAAPQLRISPRAHIIFPYHRVMDAVEELARKKQHAGTTKRGVGPVYQDKVGRFGLRVIDLYDLDRIKDRLATFLSLKRDLMLKLSQGELRKEIEETTSLDTVLSQISQYASFLEKYIGETSMYLNEQLDAQKKILFEGAQGALLDLDFGTYPFCTSSSPTSGSVCTGAGVPPTKISNIVGVFKAYSTRVGTGPFPTELIDDEADLGDQIAEKGKEFGTVTGRKRRVGWLDLPALKHAIRINGCTELAMMKIDILAELPSVKICTEYKVGTEKYPSFPADLKVFEEITPIYHTSVGWPEFADNELPSEAEAYIQFLEKELQLPIKTVSFGPERTQTLHRT